MVTGPHSSLYLTGSSQRLQAAWPPPSQPHPAPPSPVLYPRCSSHSAPWREAPGEAAKLPGMGTVTSGLEDTWLQLQGLAEQQEERSAVGSTRAGGPPPPPPQTLSGSSEWHPAWLPMHLVLECLLGACSVQGPWQGPWTPESKTRFPAL